MSHQLAAGRSFRTLNVLDLRTAGNCKANAESDFNRGGLGIKVNISTPAKRLIRSLDRTIQWRGKPLNTRGDNGPENISSALREWASRYGIGPLYIQPGKPRQNPPLCNHPNLSIGADEEQIKTMPHGGYAQHGKRLQSKR